MNPTIAPALWVTLLLTLLVLTGCGSPPTQTPNTATQPPAATTLAVPSPNPSLPLPPTPSVELVTVQIYSIDQTCENLVPSQIMVPADRSLEASIETLLIRASPQGLSPLNYSIAVDSTTGKATLDLRPTIAGDPPRSLQSLPSCEQFALFGSLQETLLRWPGWGIRSVEFTENGKPLVL